MEEVKETNRDIHNKIEKFLLRWIKYFLLCSFNWPKTKSFWQNWVFKIAIASSVVIIIMQHVFIFQNSTNIDYIIGAYFTMVAVIKFVTKHMILYQKRDTAAHLINVMENELWPLDSFDQFNKFSTIIKRMNFFNIFYCVCGLAISQILMYFPYVDKLPGQKVMPILCWYPFDINNSPVHEITYLWISLVGVFVGIGIPCFDTLFIYFLLNIILQFKLLKLALITLNQKYNKIDSEREIYRKLVFCIQYHQKLNKVYKHVQNLYEMHNFIDLLTGGITICVLTYLVQNETDFIKIIKLQTYIVCIVTNISIYCFAGSLIKAETEELSYTVYNSGWEGHSNSFQKAVLFMIKTAQVPRKITAGKLVEIGNMTLVTVLKTAFSTSVLLNDAKNK